MGVIAWVESGGDCSLPQKVINMEKAGVQAVLVAGYWKEESIWSNYAFNTDEEKKQSDEAALGYSVRIPAFLLEDEHTQIVKKYANTHMGFGGNWMGANIMLKADIEIPKSHYDYVEYSLWYTSIYDIPS